MIKSLYIKDYALIESITVEFGRGLNIITGETGAGKSILIDAMGLLLGERANIEIIRKGAEKSIVEGIFEVRGNKKVSSLLSENKVDVSDELIIRREISLKGTNRCFLNDTPVPLNLIKEAGNLLVDLHGQHEHQSLLRTETHIEMLDEFGKYSGLLDEYSLKYKELLSQIAEMKSLMEREKQIKEKKDFIEFQLKEIDSIAPVDNEDVSIENELNVLENSEKLIELSQEAYTLLYDEDGSAYDKLTEAAGKIAGLAEIDSSLESSSAELKGILASLKEISKSIRSYTDRIDLEPARLEELRERLASLNMLKKKFGGSLARVLEYREQIYGEFQLAENFAGKLEQIKKEIEKIRQECGAIAAQISKKRTETAKLVKKEIEIQLKQLGIAEPCFVIKIENENASSEENYLPHNGAKIKSNGSGIDKVEFYVSTNAGEDAKPLVKVASGGEISRIMLSLKSVLAKNDHLPLLIFDEIDTGVSGKVAQKVGFALKELAGLHQIISITHLPQIAGMADHHYAVEKRKSGERVVSSIRELNPDERLVEVAKLISGEKVSEAALESARELIEGALRN